jgi:transposase, IS30 family
MRPYTQITTEERYIIAHLKRKGSSKAEIARQVGRHRSTIGREVRRNSNRQGVYRSSKASEKANGRRSRTRKKPQFSKEDYSIIEGLLRKKWSPEQISNYLRIEGRMLISYETIYRHLWRDKRLGGELYKHLRHAMKRRRKRYGSHDSRGVMAGKRPLEQRPRSAENRSRKGHYEMDTVMGRGSRHCIMTIVDRKTGYLHIRKLRRRATEEVNTELLRIIEKGNPLFKTLTADNGTEFHQYRQVEEATGVLFYFAKPYHSWERGSNENANGLIRQYLPKTEPMTKLTQIECDKIAAELNERPRKRYGYKTPMELHF